MISGNFWIYPPKIAQGWDATPAHLPYYKLRTRAIQYLDQQRIDFRNVQTFFPNTATSDLISLNNDPRHFDNFDGRSTYVFYSNAFNIDDSSYDRLQNEYNVLKKFEKNGICVTIFKKK